MSQTAHRTGRAFLEEISDSEAWASAPPQQEARSCLQIARSNGGITHMRELIAVSEGERAELLAWAVEEPTLASKIVTAIAYREEILREFEKLLANEGVLLPRKRVGTRP